MVGHDRRSNTTLAADAAIFGKSYDIQGHAESFFGEGDRRIRPAKTGVAADVASVRSCYRSG
jgi:hypothetical protein